MKIGFVTDTNIIRKSDDELSKGMILDTTDIFIEYIEVLKKRDPNHTLVYFMPELVLKELFAQKSAFFKKQLADLNKIYGKIKYGYCLSACKSWVAQKCRNRNTICA